MKLKSAKICCAFCWSPASIPKAYLAAGSVAGAMDDDFNSEAHLEIRAVNTHDSSENMPIIGRTMMPDRVFRIDWSPHGGVHGIIAGSFMDGSIHVWSVDVILANYEKNPEADTEDPLLCRIEAHQGPVRALHFNLTQPYFLASGSQDKELLIWSLQDPKDPQSVPALPKATHAAEITAVRWSPKFPHILATATANGTVTVWDLKARRTALSFSVSTQLAGGVNALAWHPEVSTLIAVARDDASPVVQVWDMKKAVAPARELRGHSKGITSLSWSRDDPTMLLSCGCDGRTICWNPLTGDQLGELPAQENWIYEVAWSPSMPAVLASASFDSCLGVFSGQDLSGAGTRSAPRWLRRPCGASFGFGGAIVSPFRPTKEDGTRNVAIRRMLVGDASAEKEFRQQLAQSAQGTDERVQLLEQRGLQLLAAASASARSGNRLSFLSFLGLKVDEVKEELANVPKPFSLEEPEFETLLCRALVTGCIAEAVELCLAAGRFDDAFAVATVNTTLHPQSRVVLESYLPSSPALRYKKYLDAVALGNFGSLIANEAVSVTFWKETLALITTFVASNEFSAVCDALGAKLLEASVFDGAAAAYLSSGNLNSYADALAAAKASSSSLVHAVLIAEQTVQRTCSAASFASALAATSMVLANAGDFEGALLYSNRAAQLGDVEAAVVADRIQFHVPSGHAARVGFPFQLAVLPDATTIECQLLSGQQPVVQQHQQQQQPVQQQPQQPQQQVAQPQQQQQQQQQYQQQQYQQPQPPQQQYHHHHHHHNAAYAAPPLMTAQPPAHHQPQHHHHHHQAPPVQQPPHTSSFPPVHHDPTRQASPPVAPPPQQHQQQLPPPLPTSSSLPRTTTTSAPAPPTTTAAVRPAAAAPPALAVAPGSFANPIEQQIAELVTASAAQIPDKRRREAVEKSAVELLDRMQHGKVSEPVVALLHNFALSLGTPAAKENWRKLSDAHYDAIQPFLNLKFL